MTLDDRQGNVETVQADTHQQVAAEAVHKKFYLKQANNPWFDLVTSRSSSSSANGFCRCFQEAQAAAAAQAQPVAEPASAQEQASQSSESQVESSSEVNAPVLLKKHQLL